MILDKWAARVQKWIEWQNIDIQSVKALALLEFMVENIANMVYDQSIRTTPKGDFHGFILALRRHLISFFSKNEL